MEYGEHLPALMKDGDIKYFRFGEFVSELTSQKVKIPNVKFYSSNVPTDCENHELPKDSIVVGEYKDNQVNILWPLVHYVP